MKDIVKEQKMETEQIIELRLITTDHYNEVTLQAKIAGANTSWNNIIGFIPYKPIYRYESINTDLGFCLDKYGKALVEGENDGIE